jgi:hypothetical protein
MKTIMTVIGAFAIVGALIHVAEFAVTLPDVHVSYSTDECVKVINYAEGDNYSCENMPSKFNHVWVQ